MATSTQQETQTTSDTYVGNLPLLSDYTVFRSGPANSYEDGLPGISAASVPTDSDDLIDPTTEPHPRVEGVIAPDWWSIQWRRVPDYAPINYALDQSARPAGADKIEKFFIGTTLWGCALVVVSKSREQGTHPDHVLMAMCTGLCLYLAGDDRETQRQALPLRDRWGVLKDRSRAL